MEENFLEELKKRVFKVPQLPGVYLWKDKDDAVIYVGKAKQLRSRMRQYLNFADDRKKITLLVAQIRSFDYIVMENEQEALVLEKNLIQQYKPFFNVDFKDDKSYPFIAITEGDYFPSIKYTREKHQASSRYFGPFTDSRAARDIINIARRLVPICINSCTEWKRINRFTSSNKKSKKERVEYGLVELKKNKKNIKKCFDYNIGLGPGICCGECGRNEYLKNLLKIEKFLSGKHEDFLCDLQVELNEAVKELDFNKASRIQKRIKTIEGLQTKQNVIISKSLDIDAIGLCSEENITGVYVLCVRQGRLINSLEFILDKGKDSSKEELERNFILRYYDVTSSIPRVILLEVIPEDIEVIEGWLSKKLASKHRTNVRLEQPKRGEKRKILHLAKTNAKHSLLRYKVKTNYEEKRTNKALLQLESALVLSKPPLIIECYDISTIHGSHTVASMVVFINGRIAPQLYRKFKIKAELDEANDFLCMQELIARRFSEQNLKNPRFSKTPDLIIVDGGKPQLCAVTEQLDKMGIKDIEVCSLDKRDEEIFVKWDKDQPVILPDGSESLYLIKRVRDEAHRTAITYHRKIRDKAMTSSIITEVEGIGPVGRKKLLKYFHSFKNLQKASLESIIDSKLLPLETAKELYLVLHQY
ncbi:MAG: excinuclease ABC subunit C [Eggerthellaceae bacterium]|nr:excinuclease ABC subunit C [Eggerthellaceae bacterium]